MSHRPAERKRLDLTTYRYINPIGLQSLKWKFYFLYIVILVIECLCIYFLFPETKGPSLEEIAVIFDGDMAIVADSRDFEKAGVAEERIEKL